MIRAGWVFLAVLPLAAQPKLLVNAQTDTRSAAAGLEREVKTLQSAQPQPAWIGYSVPSVRSFNMGCDYVRDGGNINGVVHLEPPNSVIDPKTLLVALVFMIRGGGEYSLDRAMSKEF